MKKKKKNKNFLEKHLAKLYNKIYNKEKGEKQMIKIAKNLEAVYIYIYIS